MSRPARAAVLVFTRGPAAEGARKGLRMRAGVEVLGTVFEAVLEQACAASGAEVIVAAPNGARLPDLPPTARRIEQRGFGSGDRLERAIADVFATGVDRVVVIGDDAPEISSADLDSALAAITGPEPTAVVGPCRDGGFYLLAVNRPASEALRGVPWGSRRTLMELRRRLVLRGFALRTLRPLADIDNRADLQQFGARARRRKVARLRVLRARIAAWIRAACAWWLPLARPGRDAGVARLLKTRAPPAFSLSS